MGGCSELNTKPFTILGFLKEKNRGICHITSHITYVKCCPTSRCCHMNNMIVTRSFFLKKIFKCELNGFFYDNYYFIWNLCQTTARCICICLHVIRSDFPDFVTTFVKFNVCSKMRDFISKKPVLTSVRSTALDW